MPKVDIAIVFALEEEFQQFAPMIPSSHTVETDKRSGRAFLLFDWQVGDAAPYHCMTTYVGSMGAQDTSLVTALMLLRYNPANLILIGIAGSLDSDVQLGDVVVANEVRDYMQDAKVTDKEFLPSGRSYRAQGKPTKLLQYLENSQKRVWAEIRSQSTERAQDILAIKDIDLTKLVRANGMKIHVGHLASGPVVGASRKFKGWVKTHDRKFLALEMEAAGFMNAAYEFSDDTHVIVIRGISDQTNAAKKTMDKIGKGKLRRLAMDNALDALKALIGTDELSRSAGGKVDEDGCRILSGDRLLHPGAYGDIQQEFRNKVYQTSNPSHKTVRVFGFTYAVFWIMMKDILEDPTLKEWVFDLHSIAPEFVKEHNDAFASQWSPDASARTSEMRSWFAEDANQKSLSSRNVRVRLRTYDLLPIIHGKLFGDGTVFFHSAQWDESERLRYPNTFHEIVEKTATSDRGVAYRGLFRNWAKKYDASIRETIYASPGFNWPEFELTAGMREGK